MNQDLIIVAEIGIAHGGLLDDALKLIQMSKECGIRFVKFQKRDIEIAIPKHMRNKSRETPDGTKTYMEYKRMLEFDKNEYDRIDNYCKSLDMQWSCSVWDEKSLDFVIDYNIPFLKTPSALLTNIELLDAIAQKGIKTYIATGMSEMESIETAVDIFQKYDCPFCLVHATGLYPAPNDKLNLNFITTLKEKFECDVGYSCHSASILPSVIAVMKGASYIEKHITLNRAGWIADNAASLEKRGLEILVRDLNSIEVILGSSEKQFYDEEKSKFASMKYWK